MRAAIIGAGYIGRLHARLIREIGGEVVAVCGRTLHRRKASGPVLPMTMSKPCCAPRSRMSCMSVRPIIPQGHALKAFEAGAHVMCEKPMATTSMNACG